MKVIDLMDEIFFGGGDKTLLPILKIFSGTDCSEIFGININEDKTVRVMVINPKGHIGLLKTYEMFLGDSDGSCRPVGKDVFTRDEAMAVYGSIMGNSGLLKVVSDRDIGKASNFLSTFITTEKLKSINIQEQGE